jgi:hypothetical protein
VPWLTILPPDVNASDWAYIGNGKTLRIGLMQVSIYEIDPEALITDAIRQQLYESDVEMLVFGQHVSCDTVVVLHPAGMQEAQRYLPSVNARDIRVIIQDLPEESGRGESLVHWSFEQSLGRIREAFGQGGIWHPSGPVVRAQLERSVSIPQELNGLSNEDWIPDVEYTISAWPQYGVDLGLLEL